MLCWSIHARYLFRMLFLKLRYRFSVLVLQFRHFLIKARYLRVRLFRVRLKSRLLRLEITNYIKYFLTLLMLAKAVKQLGDFQGDRPDRVWVRIMHFTILNGLVSNFNNQSEATPIDGCRASFVLVGFE